MLYSTTLIRLAAVAFVIALSALGLTGCKKPPYEVELVGYDYTDRALLDFSVNGISGGNVFLSTKTSGGGKYACCLLLDRSVHLPHEIEVGYMREALVAYPSDRILQPADTDRVEKRVQLHGPMPDKPAYLEVHFYPDGHIDASLSGEDGPSLPRLKLERRLPYVR
ncbi:MAG TPA: DUF3304 domain-containing protein [Paraburkholderia sp.]|uniref:DUF3304 domain-containing protein n=1 Tax=Paraburkholderia sp. TaxID=1926495 RepID=UPI002B48EF3C|nr:DUF3304 domain-containing protein [Paraburkholderia sp.]HKR42622.1 DUF3304 domain-containing protein [Paraburkholderia sp.]